MSQRAKNPPFKDEALAILGDLPALWTGLDDNGKEAWVQVLFQKLVINDRGKSGRSRS
jgi:hypothetical protein